MITLMILVFLCIIGIVFLIAFPVAFYKVMTSKKSKCPQCENEIRFAANYGKCPKCRTKIYKHGDGSLRVRT